MLKDNLLKKKKKENLIPLTNFPVEVLTIIDKNDTDGHCPDGTLKNIVEDKTPTKCGCHKVLLNLYYALGLL